MHTLRRGGKNIQKNDTEKIFMTQKTTVDDHSSRAKHPGVWSETGLKEALLWTKLVEVMEYQMSYLKS